MAKEKILIMNVSDLWAALTDCSAMTALRRYFLNYDVYPETSFKSADFTEDGKVIFTATHSKFPDVEDSPVLQLPHLQKINCEK